MDKVISPRAAIYCRKSGKTITHDVRKNLDEQLRLCRELCEERGYSIVTEYIENEHQRDNSRDNPDRRAFRMLCKQIAEDEIDVVVARDEDRLYAGLATTLTFANAIRANEDIKIDFVWGQWDRTKMMIMAGIAEEELRRIKKRTLSGRHRELEAGKPPGGALPYGYQRIEEDGLLNGYPEINELEANVVRKALSMYADGQTHHSIRQTLDDMGIPPRKGGKWSVSSVRNIIYDYSFYGSGEHITELEDEKYIIEYPPLITKELTTLCEKRRQKNKKTVGVRTTRSRHLLRGLLQCPCGWTMTIRNDSRYPQGSAYRCQRLDHGKDRDPKCPANIPIRDIDPLIWSQLEQIVLNPDRLKVLIQDNLEKGTEEVGHLESLLDTMEARLEGLEREREWILNQAQAELLSTKELRSRLRDHDEKMGNLEGEASKVRGKLVEVRGEVSAHEVASRIVGEEAGELAPLVVELTDDELLPIRPEIAAVAGFHLRSGKGGEGLYVRRDEVLEALGHPEDPIQEQVNRKRHLLERYIERIPVEADDSERGFSYQLDLVFHASPTRNEYSSDWWRK